MFTVEAQEKLMAWYEENRRELPWRRTRDPYRIMVAEVMLQQTQVDRVIPKYLAFLSLFPTIESLADAPTSDVIRAWSGLGYNRRALNLQRACRAVIDQHDCAIPRQVTALRMLPGIGPYTAGAIACFAFEEDVGFVDTNIRRVLHRVIAGPELPKQQLSDGQIAELASTLVPPERGYIWNQSLIELGALICRSKQVDCNICPLAADCAAKPDMKRALATKTIGNRGFSQPKFETTSRYYRGQIVKTLLQEPSGLTAGEMAVRILSNEEHRDSILVHIDTLLADGLIIEDLRHTLSQEKKLGEASPRPYDLDPLEKRYRLPD